MQEAVIEKMFEYLHPDLEPTIVEEYDGRILVGYSKYNDRGNLSWSYTIDELILAYIGQRDFNL